MPILVALVKATLRVLVANAQLSDWPVIRPGGIVETWPTLQCKSSSNNVSVTDSLIDSAHESENPPYAFVERLCAMQIGKHGFNGTR